MSNSVVVYRSPIFSWDNRAQDIYNAYWDLPSILRKLHRIIYYGRERDSWTLHDCHWRDGDHWRDGEE